MSQMSLYSIVPRLPPSVDGLGDYGLELAKQMRQEFGIQTHFIVADPAWSGKSEIEGFSVTKITQRSEAELQKILPSSQSKLLLHYVGYGYAKRGCPFWLVKGLEAWKRRTHSQVQTMFHELYAFGPIWTSQFWLHLFQKDLCRRLVQLSDHCHTSKAKYADIIISMGNGKHGDVPTFPVFSNIGEPKNINPLKMRKSRIIIFGSQGPRKRVYEKGISALEKVCQDLMIKEIYDIGSPLNQNLPSIHGIEIQKKGILPAEEISHLMSESQVGFFSYPTEYLSKSGIFAAYCSHGLLPIGVFYPKQDVDQVEAGHHYLLADQMREKISIEVHQKISERAFEWYQTHNKSSQARSFARTLGFV